MVVTKQRVSYSLTENFRFSNLNEPPVELKLSSAGHHTLNESFKIKFPVSYFGSLFAQVQHELFVFITRKSRWVVLWK